MPDRVGPPALRRRLRCIALGAFAAACVGLAAVMALAVTLAYAHSPRHQAFWLCVHRQEATWNDPNEPYFGGLQLGWWFMRTYGRWQLRHYGTADRWPPSVQVRVVERAFRREGFSRAWLLGQWPNTAPPCLRHL